MVVCSAGVIKPVRLCSQTEIIIISAAFPPPDSDGPWSLIYSGMCSYGIAMQPLFHSLLLLLPLCNTGHSSAKTKDLCVCARYETVSFCAVS